jgi:hypothetical protein
MLSIFLNIFATIGVLGQFILESIVKNKNTKQILRLLIVFLASIGIWGSYYLQNRGNKKLSDDLSEIKNTNIELSVVLKERQNDIQIVREQNDSLKIMLAEFNKQQEEFIIISELSANEISKSRAILEDISNKSFSRGISEIDKIRMVKLLQQHTGSNIRVTSLMGDTESHQFATQLKEVFESAGWNVDGISQALYTNPVIGIKIRVKSQNYPKRVKEIVLALNELRLKHEGILDEKLNFDDIELIVGAK